MPPALPVLAALWLTVFSVTSQFLIIAPILPRIAEQMGVAPGKLGVLVSGYAAAVGVVALCAGPISDRVGRRRMLLAGTAGMSVALALHALAFSSATLVAVRVLAGAAGGMLTGAAISYVGDYFPYERRGWAAGWVMSGMATGQILGIPIGALIAERSGFRPAFLLFAASLAGSFLLVYRFLPQPQVPRSDHALDLRGYLHHYRELLAAPAVRAAASVYFAVSLGSSLYTLYLPTWLERARGVTPTQVALVFSIGGVAMVLVAPRVGGLSDRIGRRRVIVAASVGVALLMAATPWLMVGAVAAGVFFAMMAALIAARSGPLDALLTGIVPDSLRGSLMSALMAIGQLGFALGGAAAARGYASYGYPASTLAAAATALLIAALVWRFLPDPTPQPASVP